MTSDPNTFSMQAGQSAGTFTMTGGQRTLWQRVWRFVTFRNYDKLPTTKPLPFSASTAEFMKEAKKLPGGKSQLCFYKRPPEE